MFASSNLLASDCFEPDYYDYASRSESPFAANVPAQITPLLTSSSSSPMSKRNLKPSPATTSPAHPSIPGDTSAPLHIHPEGVLGGFPLPPHPSNPRKRRASGPANIAAAPILSSASVVDPGGVGEGVYGGIGLGEASTSPATKKSRTNTPWSPAEEQRLKSMRDAGNSWSEIAKTFPSRTEGSVKKHWYKDMHYAEFAEDESAALLSAIKEYEASKWKVIGQKVGKPAKVSQTHANNTPKNISAGKDEKM
ncbi:MAG: hypothetical protein M1812_004430 [Candelaria pacifica]|nr:MAG: hypothetical protein M1812_004430 [Candelaria pacifica]